MANIKWSAFTDGGEMQVGDQTVGLRAGDNFRFTFPGTGIKDVTGNYLMGWSSPGALAVNYLQLNSSVTGSAPFIVPAGSDANINLLLTSKGNGNINLTPAGTGVINTLSALILNTSSPTTALQAASKGYVDSLMPSYPITLALGGTGTNLTASNGGIFYSTASTGAILSGTATARQVLLSGSSSAPNWSTATYPSTTTTNQILYSSATNTISGLSSANGGVLVTSNSGVPSILATSGVTGNMLASNAAAAPSWSTSTYSDSYTANNLLYASSANTVSGLATANNGVLVTSASAVPSISSALPIAVQGNITNLGTITSGIWNGSVISSQYGGTGVNNGSSTITIGGNFTLSGASTFVGTLTGNTSLTFPTSGTLATTSSLPSLPLSLANGGTNASLIASNGGIFYSGATSGAVLAGTSVANQILLSGSNTAPTWSTATYPSTTVANQLIYSSSNNTIGGLTSALNSVLVTNGSGVPSLSSTLPSGLTIPGYQATITPAALTEINDTNVTLTLGGSPSTALLAATSLTLGWAGQLAVSRGGTGNGTFTSGSIVYSNGTILTQDNSNLNWNDSTDTLLATNVEVSSTTPSTALVVNSSNVITSSTTTSTELSYVHGVTSSIQAQINALSGGGIIWNIVTSGVTLVKSNGYFSNSSSLITFSLPVSASVGETYILSNMNIGIMRLAQNSGQSVQYGNLVTTVGIAGSISSTNIGDSLTIVCNVANTGFQIIDSLGQLNVT